MQYYKRCCFNGVRDEKLQTQTMQNGPTYRISNSKDIDMVALVAYCQVFERDYRRGLYW
jgi:hypothetical protein